MAQQLFAAHLAAERQVVHEGPRLRVEHTHQMFNTTLMEPSAYRHFVSTGAFREGTMLALIGQGIGTNATPARQGQFATDVHMVEMAVKESKRVPQG